MFDNKPKELKQPIWTRLFDASQFAAMNKLFFVQSVIELFYCVNNRYSDEKRG